MQYGGPPDILPTRQGRHQCYNVIMNRKWEIYSLSDPRTYEVRYIGITFRGRLRYNEHISRARHGGKTHRDCWIKSLLNIEMKPIYEIIEVGYGDGWQDAERAWIKLYREIGNIVNHTDGGDGTPGLAISDELKKKLSDERSGVPYPPGRNNAMLGKHHTQEAIEKIRAAGTGRKHTKEARLKVSRARKGKSLSDEHKIKLSIAHTGKTLTEEHKRKIGASTTNKREVVCIETGEVFESIKACARTLGVNPSSVYQSMHNGCRCKGLHYESTS